MKKLFILLISCFWLTPFIAQTTISGTVTDAASAEPLIGVNVYVQDQPTVGTVTDLDGRYELPIPAGAETVVFSILSYKEQAIAINGKTVIDVQLAEASEILKEVVVTAIGIERDKKTVGYAVESVDSETLTNARETNLVNTLSGKVAGVQVTGTSGSPGASANIVIRGRTSLNNNSPLFVVDGVPISNEFAGSNFVDHSNRAIDLNPNDIESLSVLKGSAATALYGVRAANGAIIITTKKGAAGKGRITFEQSVTFDQVNKLPEQQRLFAAGVPQGGVPTYQQPLETNQNWGPRLDTLRYDGDRNYQFSPLGRIVGQSDPSATDMTVAPFENAENFFRTGITSNTYLSFTGGSGKTNYFLSGGYLTQTGVIPQSDFTRATFKVAGDSQINDKFKVSGSANYISSGGNRIQRGSNLSGVMLGLMRTPVTFDLANGVDDPANDLTAYTYADGSPRTYWDAYDNPYWSVNRNVSTDRVNRIIGNVQADYQLTDWLKAMYRVGMDYYFEERKTFWDNQSSEFGTGVVFNDLFSFRSINSDFLLTANQKITESLSVQALAGHNYFAERSYNNIQEGETFIIPQFYDISNVAQVTFVDDTERERRIAGTFYDLQFDYKSFLFLSVTGRWDWSSTLPVEEVPFFYDSYNLGFVFTEPLGLSTNKTFSYGKLRFSYARVGGDTNRPYSLNTFFNNVGIIRGQTSFLRGTTIGNAALRPEQTESIEAGLDLRFLQNKIGLDMTVYRSVSKDQIIQVPVPFSGGFSTFITNAGEVENKGIELLLNITPYKNPDFRWDVNVNFAANENTVLELAPGVGDIRFAAAGVASTSNRAIPGQPFGVIFGTQWLRDDAGNILVNEEGYPLYDPQQPGIIGDPNPDWTMGIRNSFTFKGFYLSALLDIRQGGDIFNGTVGVMKNLGIHRSTENREEEIIWEGVYESDGTVNITPIKLDSEFYGRYPFAGVSEASIEDGSWFRLRELTLNYQLPQAWFKNSSLSSLSVGLSGRNLILITDYTGVDPETNLAGASNSFGRDWFNSPGTRSYGVNLKAQF